MRPVPGRAETRHSQSIQVPGDADHGSALGPLTFRLAEEITGARRQIAS